MMLIAQSEARLDHVAVRIDGLELTYRALFGRAEACAAALVAHGVRPGQHVAVVAWPRVETIVAIVANVLGGFVSVPINPSSGPEELAHVLEDAGPACVVSAEQSFGDRLGGRVALHVPGEAAGDGVLCAAVFDEGDPLLVLYTSGTTGRPKGAVLTAGNVASNLDALADAWKLGPSDTVVHALPLFHVHGLVLGLLGPLRLGATLEWVPRFDPELVARALLRTRGVLYAVPTMHHRLADRAEEAPEIRRGLAAARLLVSGSAPLSEREHRRIEALSGQRVLERYGLTETIIDCAMRAGEPTAVGTVGRALAGVELGLVDDARAAVVPHDGATLGEVRVRGPNVFAGYLGRPEATAAVLDRDGWFYTGDLASMTPDGVVRIVGRRATDLIKTGGFKVGAGEVEAALLEHPAVAEAAVVGAPDDDLGERIEAWIVLRSSAQATLAELSDHVARTLAPHKRPRAVHFVEALPRNAMGKVLKASLRVAPREQGPLP